MADTPNPQNQTIAMMVQVRITVPWETDAPVQMAFEALKKSGRVEVLRSHNLVASKGETRQAIKAAQSPPEQEDGGGDEHGNHEHGPNTWYGTVEIAADVGVTKETIEATLQAVELEDWTDDVIVKVEGHEENREPNHTVEENEAR